MTVLIVFLAGIIGTMVMTCFSHIIEIVTRNKLNEAQLINILLDRSSATQSIGENHYFGWVIHFLIGVILSFGLWLYYSKVIPIAYSNYGFCVGIALGIIGIIGWSLILNFHPNSPENNWLFFYVQLIVAHIFFAVTATFFLSSVLA